MQNKERYLAIPTNSSLAPLLALAVPLFTLLASPASAVTRRYHHPAELGYTGKQLTISSGGESNFPASHSHGIRGAFTTPGGQKVTLTTKKEPGHGGNQVLQQLTITGRDGHWTTLSLAVVGGIDEGATKPGLQGSSVSHPTLNVQRIRGATMVSGGMTQQQKAQPTPVRNQELASTVTALNDMLRATPLPTTTELPNTAD